MSEKPDLWTRYKNVCRVIDTAQKNDRFDIHSLRMLIQERDKLEKEIMRKAPKIF